MKWLRRFARRRWVILSVVVVIILIAGGAYYSQTGSSSTPQYETVAANLGNISQSISISGTIEPVTDLELNFGSTGLVSTVNVQPGQSVKAGQVMATLDTTSLQAQVTQAQATLLSNQAKLASDEAGPTASAQQSSQAQITSAQNALAAAKQSLADTQASNQITLTQSQTAISQAQTALASDQTTLLLDQQNFAKYQPLVVPSTNATLQPVPVAASASAYDSTNTNGLITTDQSYLPLDQNSLFEAQTTEANCAGSSSCSSGWQAWINGDNTAMSAANTAISQANKVISDLEAVQNAQNNLAATQVKITQSLDQAQQSVTSAQTALTNAQNAASVSSQPATPSQIDADNAAIASAQASLANAQQALTEATIVAPVGGVVAQVNISAGKTTTTSSSTSGDIVLESANSFEVTGQVSDTQISEVKLNQQALVTPAGQTASLAAKVNQITPMATVTQGVATFPVNVLITQQSPNLYAGASATVQIIVKQATNVLTVPTSSVHSLGSLSYVNVLQSGQSVRKLVTVGASSGIYTEVTSGLQPGDQVIVANRSAGLPSATNNFRANRAVGGFGGGGFGGGGLVGGGGPGRG